MRRYYIVSGILFILSIIDFALAAPLPAQGKHQAFVDAVHTPKDVMAVPGKRGGEELENLAEQYFKTWGKPIDSSDAHAASSSAPPGPDHGAPNPASSTAKPEPSMEPSSPLSTAPMQGSESWDDRVKAWDDNFSNKGSATSLEPLFTPTGSGYGPGDEWLVGHSPKPKPNPNTLAAGLPTGADPNFNWEYWMNLDDSPPRPGSPSQKGFDPTPGYHVQEPDQELSTGPDPNFDWEYWRR